MATGDQNIRFNLIANVRDFLRGTQDAASGTRQLSDSLDDVSTRSTVSMTRVVESVSPKKLGRAFRESGKQIGSDFVGSLGQSIGSGQAGVAGTVISSFTNLPGIGLVATAAAGIGALFTTTLIKNLSKGKAEFDKAVEAYFAVLKENADPSTGFIKPITTFQQTTAMVEKLRELWGGPNKSLKTAMQEVQRLSDLTGVSVSTIADVVAGRVNPETETFRERLENVVKNGTTTAQVYGKQGGVATAIDDSAKAAQELLTKTQGLPGALAAASAAAETFVNLTRNGYYYANLHADAVARAAQLYKGFPTGWSSGGPTPGFPASYYGGYQFGRTP